MGSGRILVPPTATGRRRSTGRAERGSWQASVYLLPAAVILAALSIYPLIELVRMSVSDVGPRNLIGDWPLIGGVNFGEVLADDGFWEAAQATALFTGVILVSNLVLGYYAALVLSRGSWLADFVLSLMVLVWALPPLVSGSVWKFLLSGSGAVNAVLQAVGLPSVNWLSSPQLSMWSVSMVAAWASLPFATLIIRGGFLSVPVDILEAATLDGANVRQINLRVIVPMIRPTLAVLVILSVLYAFRSFDFVYVMTQGGPGTVTTTLPYLAYQTAFKTYSFGLGATVAVLSMVVVVVLAIPYILGVRKEEQH